MRKHTVLLVSMGLGFTLIVLVGSILLDQPYRYHGSIIEPPIPAADFVLTDQDGRAFRSADLRGKLALLFFGYTHCPDICPTTLTEYQTVYQRLKDRADEVIFIFITVDPERDSPEILKDYVSYFNPHFFALTSDRQILEEVWQDYGVYQARQEVSSAAGYLVDHSTRIYLVDAAGNLAITYPFGFEATKITQDLLHMLAQGGQP